MGNEGLVALKELRENGAVSFSKATISFTYLAFTKRADTIEKELKAKANLVSMCENLAKLVGLKEKDYVELETLITKKLKALEIISKAYGDYANHKISEYELIMAVGENI